MIRALAPLVLLGLVATGCTPGGNASTAPDQIIIASDLPVSGFEAGARPMEEAIEFAIHEQGSIGGFKLGYWSLDNSLAANANAVRAVGNVERMIAERRVLGMVGPYTSGVAIQAIQVANPSDLVMVSPTVTDFCLTRAASHCDPMPFCTGHAGCAVNLFRITPPDPIQGMAMARYAAANLNVKRVAAVNELGADGNQYIKEFAAELTSAGGELVFQDDFEAGTTDFTGFLNTAKNKGAQAIYVVGYGNDRICSVRAQMNTLLPEAYFLATDAVMDEPSPCIKDAVDPVRMLTTHADVDPTASPDSSVKAHVDAYLKAHPKASDVSGYTFAAYDCARILIDAIARAIQSNHGAIPTRAQVVAAVAQTHEFKGVTGTYSFDANGDAQFPMMSIMEVRDGKWVYLQKIDASSS
ncbi:MAG TPA: branched-chain amino acid ABC transporter substrate-binding protein [Candidatus Dormibacteraeota bacterium]|nr:branched-chain amino acid ABC transporter substrate-binding protein [Candidatus Dormibacteraeota bacterium]